jgi:hypothetical protein
MKKLHPDNEEPIHYFSATKKSLFLTVKLNFANEIQEMPLEHDLIPFETFALQFST